MKHIILAAFGTIMIACSADAQALMSVGAESKFGTLDNVEFESVAVSPFLDDQRIYLCYKNSADGDYEIGEQLLGSVGPVKKTDTSIRVIGRIVIAQEHPSEPRKTQFYEFPKESFRDLADPWLGPRFKGLRGKLAIVLQAETLTVFMSGSDGGEAYKVNWIIDVKEHKVMRIDSSAEGDRVNKKWPWVQLREISEPKIVFSTKK